MQKNQPMKVVLAIDSLKGSLSSIQAGNAAREGILNAHPDAKVIVRPLADGGREPRTRSSKAWERRKWKSQ